MHWHSSAWFADCYAWRWQSVAERVQATLSLPCRGEIFGIKIPTNRRSYANTFEPHKGGYGSQSSLRWPCVTGTPYRSSRSEIQQKRIDLLKMLRAERMVTLTLARLASDRGARHVDRVETKGIPAK